MTHSPLSIDASHPPTPHRIALRVWCSAIFIPTCVFAFVATVALLERPVTAQEPAAPAAPPDDKLIRFEGVASCSASACHGGGRPLPGGRIWGNEYSLWATRDPHHRAYRLLFEQRSQRILENLFQQSNFEALTLDQQQTCLACHSTAALAPAEFRDVLLADGVSCESCHGPAGDWLGPHTVATWSQRRQHFVESGALCDTKDLHTRAQRCATCHVGAAGQEVNHDLIAAGHPRMFFEFSAYLDHLPKHWTEEDTAPDFEARAWALGQLTTAQQALDLLASRADQAERRLAAPPSIDRPLLWPEFSEYGCYACHHELSATGAAPPRHFGLAPGQLPWGTWYYTLLRHLTAPDQDPTFPIDAATCHASLAEIDAAMRQLAPHPALFTTLNTQIPRVTGALQSAAADLQHRRVTSTEALVWMLDLATIGVQSADWDETVQALLAITALNAATADGDLRSQVTAHLTELRDLLRFNDDYDSPRDFDPAAPRAIFKQLQSLLAQSLKEQPDA